MKIAYESWRPDAASLRLVRQADAIATALAAQGYTLTLRQLYYQFVHQNIFANVEKNYDRLGRLVERGRMAGLIDWDHIVDRTRRYEHVPHWRDPNHILADDAEQFRLDKWADQSYYVEAWVEKEALIDVIAQPARRHDIGWFACRGYASASSQHEAAMRFVRAIRRGQEPIILHFGDHDPSGIDMSRDIYARINGFVGLHLATEVEVQRLALNMAQIEQYDPPPNPAKQTDSRFAGYRKRFGESSWELDALDPPTIDALIETAVLSFRDDELWTAARKTEDEHRSLLARASDRWAEVADFLNQDETS